MVKDKAMKKEAEIELSAEDKAFLEERNKKNTNWINIPIMVINGKPVNKEGKDVPVNSFNILRTDKYSRTVTFRPIELFNKYEKMVEGADKKWFPSIETILFNDNEQAIDTKGGVAGGRLPYNAVPESWTKEQKILNMQKADWMGYLFGRVYFDDSDTEGTLVLFKMPYGRLKQVRKGLSKKTTGQDMYQKVTYKMTLDASKKATEDDFFKFEPILDEIKSVTDILPDWKGTVIPFVNQHNSRIRTIHQNVVKARSDAKADESIVANAENDLDDSVPF